MKHNFDANSDQNCTKRLYPEDWNISRNLKSKKKKNPPSYPVPTYPLGFLNLYLLNFDSCGISKICIFTREVTKMRLFPLRKRNIGTIGMQISFRVLPVVPLEIGSNVTDLWWPILLRTVYSIGNLKLSTCRLDVHINVHKSSM